MATPDKSLFKEKTQREKDQEMISGIGAKAAMDAGISKNARAKLDRSSPAIKDAIKRRNLAQKQLDERKAKKDAKTNTVNYSDATRPKKTTSEDKPKDTAKKFNVGVSKGGVPFKTAFKHYRDKGNKTFTWNGKKYTTKLDTETKPKGKTGSDDSKPKKKGFRPFGGAIRRALLGKDEKFGGDKGAIDFIRRKKKPKNKAGGGMMKSKMSSKGGKMGGKMVRGYKDGDEVRKAGSVGVGKNSKKDKPGSRQGGKPVPKDNKGLAKLPKNVRNKMGYMKGGGMAKKGYSKGGAAMKSKGGTKRGKPRGVGAALRGYGKAMR